MVWWQCDCFFLETCLSVFFLVHSEVCTLFFPTRLLPELEEFRWSGCQGSLFARNYKEQFCQSKIYRKKSCPKWKNSNNIEQFDWRIVWLSYFDTNIHTPPSVYNQKASQASSIIPGSFHHLESIIVSIVSDRFWASNRKWIIKQEMRNVTRKAAALSRTLLTLSPLISEAISHS